MILSRQGIQIEWREDAVALFQLCAQEPDPRKRARLQVLWLVRQGRTLKQAAQILGVHYRTAQRWVAWYRVGGVGELRRRRPGGYPDQEPGLTLTQQAALELGSTSYRLMPDESIPAGIKRIAQEQADRALGQLVDLSNNRDEAIHDARKCFKKIRATLRLVRDEIGEPFYKRENICYRDAGRRIAAVRDSAVLIETLDKLGQHYAAQLRPEAFADIRAWLVERHQIVCEEVIYQGSAVDEVISVLEAARQRVADWPIERDDFAAFYGGMRRVYRRGRNRLADAYAAPNPEIFHEWRKRLKYLWYHMRILRDLWPGQLEDFIDLLKDLADILGDAHDLVVLREALLRERGAFDAQEELEVVLPLIEQRQRELEAAARFPGRRVYVERPKAFVDRFAGYWDVWQAEIAADSA